MAESKQLNMIKIQCHFLQDLTHLSGLKILSGLIQTLQMYFSPPETTDFNKRPILLNNDADGEVKTHTSHLVMEAQNLILDHLCT